MLALLIAKEIRGHLLSYRFVLTFLLFFVLIVSSVEIIALNYDRQAANHAETRRSQEESLKEATDFRSLRWRGFKVEKAPNPLSVFAMGLEREMSRSVKVSRFEEAKLGRSKYANPLFALFPAPDLLYIVNIVGSLLAVLFAFDAVCGEQEEGTLKLVMAYSVPRHLVLLAKWIGGFTALILPFLASVFTALLFAELTTSLTFVASDWSAFLGVIGVAVIYMAVFYALAMWISTLTHRSTTSLVLSFLIWVVLVLLVPNTAPMAARAMAPVPSPGVIAGQREGIQREVWRGVRRRRREVRGEEREALIDQAMAEIRSQTDKVMADYLQKVDSQIRTGILLARLSPSASYVYATAGLASTGLMEFTDLREYIGRYRIEFLDAIRQMEEERNRQLEGVTDEDERQEIRDAPIDPDDLPEFSPERAGLAENLVAVQTDLLILIVLNAVFFLGAYSGFLRYDLMK